MKNNEEQKRKKIKREFDPKNYQVKTHLVFLNTAL